MWRPWRPSSRKGGGGESRPSLFHRAIREEDELGYVWWNMKISFDNGKTWFASQGAVSPENAAKKLRNRIGETLLGTRNQAYQACRLDGMEVNQDLYYWGIMVFAIAIIFWPDARRSATAVSEVFMIGTALLLIWTYLDIRKHFNIRYSRACNSRGYL